jgi:hypothetical protein
MHSPAVGGQVNSRGRPGIVVIPQSLMPGLFIVPGALVWR